MVCVGADLRSFSVRVRRWHKNHSKMQRTSGTAQVVYQRERGAEVGRRLDDVSRDDRQHKPATQQNQLSVLLSNTRSKQAEQSRPVGVDFGEDVGHDVADAVDFALALVRVDRRHGLLVILFCNGQMFWVRMLIRYR